MKLKAVVFDWAGTIVDFGSFAPAKAFVDAFADFGVAVSVADARKPMGLPKRDHIEAMLDMPHVAAAWTAARGGAPDGAAIDALYDAFLPRTETAAADCADLIPGAGEAVATLRARGLRIGSTTGYARSVMERVAPRAAERGYAPDNMVCADDLPEGRPGPLCMYQCFIDLRAHPAAAVLKVDDTAAGIAEGVAAGCPSVGVALSGNAVGRTPEEVAQASEADRDAWRADARAALTAAGAIDVIDTVADLPAWIDARGL